MFTTTMPQPDPEVFMNQYLTDQFATKANKWLGRNSTRYSNPEYDKTYLEAQAEMDPVKRAALFIKMNDMPINDVAIIPVVYRPRTSGAVSNLVAPLSGWDNDLWLIKDWFRNV
jgi:peptide/nickel transport system substrate-binding protein